jgi:hypothetical protein
MRAAVNGTAGGVGDWAYSTRPDRLGIAVSPARGFVQFLARATELGVIVGLLRMMGRGGWCSPRRSSDGQMIFSMIIQVKDHGSDLWVWVELRGFEPLTPSMRTRCATGLRYSPKGTAVSVANLTARPCRRRAPGSCRERLGVSRRRRAPRRRRTGRRAGRRPGPRCR